MRSRPKTAMGFSYQNGSLEIHGPDGTTLRIATADVHRLAGLCVMAMNAKHEKPTWVLAQFKDLAK